MKRFLSISTIALSMALAAGAPVYAADMLAGGKTSVVKIDTGRGGSSYQSLAIGAGKAAIIELPVDVRDVLVSNPMAVDAVVRSPRQVYLLGMTAGTSTNVVFFDMHGRQIMNLDVAVGHDTSALEDLLANYIPNRKIKVEAVRGSLILSGTVANASEADRAVQLARKFVVTQSGGTSSTSTTSTAEVVNLLQVAGSEQVMLKVRIVEMQRTLLKSLGINLAAAGLSSGGHTAWSILQNNGGFAYDADLGTITTPFSAGSTVGFSSRNGSTAVDGALKALENLGLVRTLAEPNLTAISGEPAKFLAGGEIPVDGSLDQNGNVTTNYKPYGVGLGFTPTVMSEGRISLKMNTEVSDIGPGGTATRPTFTVRRAETTVELPSGGSLVIAGLLQSRLTQNSNGFPGLKDVPVLGALFRSKEYMQNETELVIMVTPYLVSPTSPNKLSTPADGYQPSNEAEGILLGRMNKVYKPGEAPTANTKPAGQAY